MISRLPHSPSKGASERGASMMEAAFVMPVLLLVFFSLAQGIVLSQAYLSINHIAREAVISAATVKNAAASAHTDLNPSESAVVQCLNSPATPDPMCAHLVSHWRIRRLLESHGLPVSEFSFSSSRSSAGPGRGVEVAIHGTPTKRVPMMSLKIVRAIARSEYVAQ